MRPSPPLAILCSASALLYTRILAQDVSECVTRDSPNPHADDYPNFVSGNLNGTTLIVPISLETARQVIPGGYGILEHAYRTLLPPSFPQDAYPMMAVGVHDHDIQFPAYDTHPADFSRAALEFPFLDILGDNYSTFRWAATMLITEGNDVAIGGSESFGVTVYPASFDPPCDAYAHLEGDSGTANGMTHYFQSNASNRLINLQSVAFQHEYSLNFLKNITNQPVFANDTAICDNYRRLYNTSLTQPPNEPTPVRGRVEARVEPFHNDDDDAEDTQIWENDVFGWRISTGFLEPPIAANCEALKGFNGEW